MAEEAMSKAGLYFDELNKVRLLDPEIAAQTTELREECKDFTDKIAHFQKILTAFEEILGNASKEVDKAKMKAIGSRNLLKSISMQRDAEQQQLKAQINEKKLELDRLRKQYEALANEDKHQNDFVEQLILQK